MTPGQLEDNVTILTEGEYYPVIAINESSEDNEEDVLDEGHVYLSTLV